MAALKKIKMLASDLSEKLELPEEALLGETKLTVTAGRRALIENHRGILEYGPDYIAVSTRAGRLGLSGSGMTLLAMNRRELLIGGKIQSVEWG